MTEDQAGSDIRSYPVIVSKPTWDDLSAAVRDTYPNRLPGESFSEYVRRRPKGLKAS